MKKIIILCILCFIGFNIKAQTLYIFGGENHDVFLGCLNCNTYTSNSIWNEYGTYGNHYSITSIWNEYGTYGSTYSSLSPWNSYASDPPVVVDENGNFYGYLTINIYNSQRATFQLALILYNNYRSIRQDVSSWYNQIFSY
jgi:hypothetical protein